MEPELNDRLDRAARIDPDYYIVETDPLVVEFDSPSGNTHTILPETGYCGCEDRRYRYIPCKHLLALAQEPDPIGLQTAKGIRNEVERLEAEIEYLEEELAKTTHIRDLWNGADDAVGEEASWIDDFEQSVTRDDVEAWESGASPTPAPDDISRIADTASVE